MTDDLTGVATHAQWVNVVDGEVALGETGNVLLFDVDRLADINAEYGHAIGDLVLVEVARILGRHGFAGRVGGDEFALWLPGDLAGSATAEEIIAEVWRAFAQRGALGVSVSVGVARSTDAVRPALDRAAQALQVAKAAGRDRASYAHLAA